MQVIRGIATDVGVTRTEPAAFELRVNGDAAFIDLSGDGADAPPIRDGDEVVMAGKAKNGLFTALAYKNLTENQTAFRVSSRQEAGFAWFMFCFGAVSLRLSWTNPTASQDLFPLPQWFTIGLGGMALFFAVICLLLVAEKFAAQFLVDRAALETLVGEAKVLEPESPGRYPKVEVQGRSFFLETCRRFSAEEGDKLAVTVEKTKDGVVALTFANLTRSTSGRSRAAGGQASAMAFGLAFAGVVTSFASEWLFDDAANIMIFLVGVSILIGTAMVLMGNFYRWKLTREALRLTEAAASEARPRGAPA